MKRRGKPIYSGGQLNPFATLGPQLHMYWVLSSVELHSALLQPRMSSMCQRACWVGPGNQSAVDEHTISSTPLSRLARRCSLVYPSTPEQLQHRTWSHLYACSVDRTGQYYCVHTTTIVSRPGKVPMPLNVTCNFWPIYVHGN